MAVHPGLISLNKLRIEQSLNQNLCENKSIQDRRGEKEETNAFRADLGRFENIGNGEIQLEYKRNTTKPTQHRSRIYQPSLRQTNPKPRIWADLLPDDEKIG